MGKSKTVIKVFIALFLAFALSSCIRSEHDEFYKKVSTGYVYLDSVTTQKDSLVEWYSVSRVEKDSVITEFLLKVIRSIADYEKDNLLIKSQKMKELYDNQEK